MRRPVELAFGVLCWVTYLFAGHELGCVALALLVPAFIVHPSIDQRRRRRECAGRCPHCQYDLRGPPDRCPECGTFTSATPSALRRPNPRACVARERATQRATRSRRTSRGGGRIVRRDAGAAGLSAPQ